MASFDEVKLEDILHGSFATFNPNTGANKNADSLPTLEIYEEGNNTPMTPITSLVTNKTTGRYRWEATIAAADGFEQGKFYEVWITATVTGTDTITQSAPVTSFKATVRVVDDLATPTNITAATGITLTPTNGFGTQTGTLSTVTTTGTATAVTTVNGLAENVITATSIAANAITDVKINTGAITASKFAAGAIDAAAIASSAITDSKIASAAITSAKFAPSAISSTAIAADAIGASQIATGAITSAKFAAGAINAAAIATDAIDADALAADAIAEINATMDTALADIHLDHLLAVDYDPAAKPGVATALFNELIESNAGVSRYTASALAQAPTGGSAPTASQIADEVQTRTIAAVTTVTTLTNLPAIPANWITAAGITAGALNGKGDWTLGTTVIDVY